MSNIFKADELTMLKPDGMTRDEILGSDGIFFLKDLIKPLVLDRALIKRQVDHILSKGQDPWDTVGVKRLWSHWVVRMSRFRHLYLDALYIEQVDSDWDANECLRQKGIFSLADVCKLIPVTSHQIRYQARGYTDSRVEIGVWKDEERHIFLVDMEPFARYISKVWSSPMGYRRQE